MTEKLQLKALSSLPPNPLCHHLIIHHLLAYSPPPPLVMTSFMNGPLLKIVCCCLFQQENVSYLFLCLYFTVFASYLNCLLCAVSCVAGTATQLSVINHPACAISPLLSDAKQFIFPIYILS